MTKLQKLIILEKIQELEKVNIDIIEVDNMLFNYLLKAMPYPIRKAYSDMISSKIPF